MLIAWGYYSELALAASRCETHLLKRTYAVFLRNVYLHLCGEYRKVNMRFQADLLLVAVGHQAMTTPCTFMASRESRCLCQTQSGQPAACKEVVNEELPPKPDGQRGHCVQMNRKPLKSSGVGLLSTKENIIFGSCREILGDICPPKISPNVQGA